jgi:hypothetical protein
MQLDKLAFKYYFWGSEKKKIDDRL